MFGWLKSKAQRAEDAALEAWRAEWQRAAAGLDPAAVERLRAALGAITQDPESVEIEREMLDGLVALVTLAGNGALPVVATGHKVVGSETCHFAAPASRPDDPAQTSGRLFLTATRAIFAGGARGLSIAWHTVHDVAQSQRDIVLVGRTPESVQTFRCNSYADALCGAFIARAKKG